MLLYITIGVIVTILVLAFAIVATIFGWWHVVLDFDLDLDLVLVIVVLINAIMLAFLAWAIFTVIRTIREMRAEITPIIGSLGETPTTVTETAKVTQLFGLRPVARTATLLVSAAGVAQRMLGRSKTPTRGEARQTRREEVDQQIAAREEQSAGQAQARQPTPQKRRLSYRRVVARLALCVGGRALLVDCMKAKC